MVRESEAIGSGSGIRSCLERPIQLVAVWEMEIAGGDVENLFLPSTANSLGKLAQ